MANTINYYYQQIITQKQNTSELNVLDSTSSVSNFNLWAYIVATVMMILDNLFTLHRQEVDNDLATLKPHGLSWYQALALRFQYGQDTIPDSDQYANTGLSAAQIAAQLIIAQAAVTEVSTATSIGLRVKVVSENAGAYAVLTTDQLTAFTAFMNLQKDAGVNIIAQSLPGDGLKNAIQLFYDALILKSDGSRIDGTSSTPVLDGYNAYLQSLPYNGEYSNTALSNYLQTVSGVVLVNITLAQAQYGSLPYTNIDELYVPDGGYLTPASGYPILTFTPYPG